MTRYACHAVVTGSKFLGYVEAENEEEAREMAFALDSASICLCHQCSDNCEDAEVTEVVVEVYS